jgi:7,8-dihydro-6-hydroxymethylpterin-pyrophosphokinase
MLKEYPKFTAAAVQAAPEYRDEPVYFDSQATLANVVTRIQETAANGAPRARVKELERRVAQTPPRSE